VNWSQGKTRASNMVVVAPSTTKTKQSTDGLVQAMSQVSLKVEEIKSLKGDIEKMQQEMRIKDEKMASSRKRIKLYRKG
jgi:predicted transcriptional regulator